MSFCINVEKQFSLVLGFSSQSIVSTVIEEFLIRIRCNQDVLKIMKSLFVENIIPKKVFSISN